MGQLGAVGPNATAAPTGDRGVPRVETLSFRRLSSTDYTRMRRLSRGLPRVGRGFISCAAMRVKVVVMISVYVNANDLPSDYFCSFNPSSEMRYSFAAAS